MFNLMIGKGVFSAVRRLGNTALCNGIGVSNMSLGAVVRFTALLLGWRKYVGDKEYALPSGTSTRSDAGKGRPFDATAPCDCFREKEESSLDRKR